MYIILCICLFVIGFMFGFIIMGILAIKYYEDKFFDVWTGFENRIDFSFKRYFGFGLFPNEDKKC